MKLRKTAQWLNSLLYKQEDQLLFTFPEPMKISSRHGGLPAIPSLKGRKRGFPDLVIVTDTSNGVHSTYAYVTSQGYMTANRTTDRMRVCC